MKNKKGIVFTAGFFVGLVLGIIGLILLLYVAYKGFDLLTNKSNLKKAQINIKLIDEALKKAKNNEKKESEIIILNPNKWWIISWPFRQNIDMPLQCSKDYCICICNRGRGIKDSLNKCDFFEKTCIDVDEKIKTFFYPKYSDSIYYETGEAPIPIENPPVKLNIKYDKIKGFEVIFDER